MAIVIVIPIKLWRLEPWVFKRTSKTVPHNPIGQHFSSALNISASCFSLRLCHMGKPTCEVKCLSWRGLTKRNSVYSGVTITRRWSDDWRPTSGYG